MGWYNNDKNCCGGSGAAAAAHPAADAVAGGVRGGPGALIAATAAGRFRAAHARLAPRHRHAAAAGVLCLQEEKDPGKLILVILTSFVACYQYILDSSPVASWALFRTTHGLRTFSSSLCAIKAVP